MKTLAKIKSYAIIGGILIVLASCTEMEFEMIPDSVYPYHQTFQNEALKRGIRIDYDLVVEWIDDNNVYGRSSRSPFNNNVTVKLTRRFWDNWDGHPLKREFVIMHELGHAVLNREHNSKSSFMNIGAMEIRDFAKSEESEDYESIREEYYNELFGSEVL